MKMNKTEDKNSEFIHLSSFRGDKRSINPRKECNYYYVLGKDDVLWYMDVMSNICTPLAKIQEKEELLKGINLKNKNIKKLTKTDLSTIKKLLDSSQALAAISKPDVQFIWAAGGDKIDPGAVKVDLGWLSAEKPPFQFFNFWQNKVDQYIGHNNQYGINVWDTVTEYQVGSMALASDMIHYVSSTVNTNSDPISNPSDWSRAFVPELETQKESKYYNYVINGGMKIWQRNDLFNLSGAQSVYTADRWTLDQGSGTTQISKTSILANPSYPAIGQVFNAMNISRTVAGSTVLICNKIEDVTNLSGVKNSLTFMIPTNSFEPGTTIGIEVIQNFGTGGAPSAPVTTPIGLVDLDTADLGWNPHFFVFDMPTIFGKVLGTNNDSFVQLCFIFSDNLFNIDLTAISYTMSPVKHQFAPRNQQEEIALCQRYYEKSYRLGASPGTNSAANIFSTREAGNNNSAYTVSRSIQYKTTKRSETPTITTYSEGGTIDTVDVESGEVTPIIGDNGDSSFIVTATNVGATTDRDLIFHWTAESEL